jgi:Fur family transcriptional regulator, ferric uptake regulator
MSYVTRQKQVLGRVFARAKRPLMPAEICDEARKEIPSLGIATVYRTLRQFLAEGLVRAVEIPGAAPHYESSAGHHHHFFVCRECKRLYELIGCIRDVGSLAPRGFRVRQHEIVLYGECGSCLKGVASRRR